MIETVVGLTRRPWLRWCVAVAIAGVAIATVAHAATTGGDFRLSVWYPGQALFHGRDPYDIASFEHYYGSHQVEAFSSGWFPFYSPVHLWLAVVFALFPVAVASALWFVLNLGGVLAIAAVVARALDRRLGGPAIVAITGFLVLSRPGRATLEQGQTTVIYVLLTYVAWSQVRRRPWLAALALACALGKPPFGLPLFALIVARRLWPVALRAVAILIGISLPIVIWLTVNAGSPVALWRAIAHNLSYTDHNPLDAPGSPGRIDGLSLIARHLHGHFGGGAEVGAFVVVVGVAAAFIAGAARRPGWPLTPAVVLLLGVATVVGVAHEYYDLLLLAWPFAAAIRRPAARLVDRLGLSAPPAGVDDLPTVRDGGRGGVVLALFALPALVVTVIPANDTVNVLGLGSATSVISTLTTACLLVAMAGAMIGIAFDHPQEEAAGAPSATGAMTVG